MVKRRGFLLMALNFMPLSIRLAVFLVSFFRGFKMTQYSKLDILEQELKVEVAYQNKLNWYSRWLGSNDAVDAVNFANAFHEWKKQCDLLEAMKP
jgi:hypothetical protein